MAEPIMLEITENDLPIEVATKLIRGGAETLGRPERQFSVCELKEIARHLNVYCNSAVEREKIGV